MQIPLQITLRDIPQSDAIEDRIRKKAEKLNRFYDRIMACRVTVEAPQRRQRKGKVYNTRVDLTVPGAELVVTRAEHEDAYVAIRDAFDAAARQLEDYARQQRGEVKEHDVGRHGRIIKMFPAQGYGFIETPDRQEIYFHRNSVVDPDFDRLDVGMDVMFVPEEGDEGPQARMVTVGKHDYPD